MTVTQDDRKEAEKLAIEICGYADACQRRNDAYRLLAYREQAMIEGARLALEAAAGWPLNARFQYGDPVSAIVKREGQPRFPGYVVGWYRPRDGRHMGYAVEHERDGIIHVYPDAALQAGFE